MLELTLFRRYVVRESRRFWTVSADIWSDNGWSVSVSQRRKRVRSQWQDGRRVEWQPRTPRTVQTYRTASRPSCKFFQTISTQNIRIIFSEKYIVLILVLQKLTILYEPFHFGQSTWCEKRRLSIGFWFSWLADFIVQLAEIATKPLVVQVGWYQFRIPKMAPLKIYSKSVGSFLAICQVKERCLVPIHKRG